MNFSSTLLNWYNKNKRELPWRKTKNPYKIWLSEIILQQTRVNQGLKYYKNFIRKFPNILSLAKATEDEVLKTWEGLGYYSRARNLHKTAKIIVKDYNSIFPITYENLLRLPGVGPYTAAAISSICFNKKEAVVDGNVFRVLSRFFNIKTPINSTKGKKQFALKAKEILPTSNYGDYNQSIMEFGALWCTPHSPNCKQCVLKSKCKSFENNNVNMLPVKESSHKLKNRFFEYFLIEKNGCLLVKKRIENDIWKHLYEFPLIEYKIQLKTDNIKQSKKFKLFKSQLKIDAFYEIKTTIHKLSHQKIHCRFWSTHCFLSTEKNMPSSSWIKKDNIHKLAFPRAIQKELNNLL